MVDISIEYNVSTEAQYRHALIPCLSEIKVLSVLLRMPTNILSSCEKITVKPEGHRLYSRYLRKRPDISIVIYVHDKIIYFPVEIKRYYGSVEYERQLPYLREDLVLPKNVNINKPTYLVPFNGEENVESIEGLIRHSENKKSKVLFSHYKEIDLVTNPTLDSFTYIKKETTVDSVFGDQYLRMLIDPMVGTLAIALVLNGRISASMIRMAICLSVFLDFDKEILVNYDDLAKEFSIDVSNIRRYIKSLVDVEFLLQGNNKNHYRINRNYLSIASKNIHNKLRHMERLF